MAKIFNWMGHSGSEPGAHGLLKEDDVTRQARTWSVAYMRACGHTVVTDSDNMSLVQRINTSRNGDAIIEWHANILGNGQAHGTEAWYSQYDTGRGVKAAQAVAAATTKFGFTNRGAKNSKNNRYGRLGILDDPKPTAVLVELFFLDNAADVARWKKNGKAFVESLTAAFLKSLGYKSSPVGDSVSKPLGIVRVMYSGKEKVPLYNDAKEWVGQSLSNSTAWKVTGVDNTGKILDLGRQENIETKYVKIVLRSDTKGVDDNLKPKTGATYKKGSSWKVTSARIVDGQAYYLIGTNTWIGGKDTK